jgi:membrane protease subunit (stomatin/prohibitin family)
MALYRNITWNDGYFDEKATYKARKVGYSWDGQSSGRPDEGIVGAPIYWRPGSNGEIVYKYPFDNIRNGAVVIVHQTQRAFLYLNGALVSSIPSTGEPYRLTTSNIPYLRHLLNIPTGDTTAHTAEIWFVNVETEREAPWGMGNLPVYDHSLNAEFIIGAHGRFNLRVADSELFIKKLVGTLHDFNTGDVLEYFQSKISSIAAQTCSEIMEEEKLSLSSIQRMRTRLERQIEDRINESLYIYGIRVGNFAIRSFKIPEEYNTVLSAKTQGVAERIKLEQLGIDYTKEKQMEIMLKAAGNEGSGTIMAAGIGANMAAGVTPLLGPYINNTAGLVLPPSPPPLPSYYFIIGNVQAGPYTINDIIMLKNAGKITLDSLYWCQGMPQWQNISSSVQLRGLFNSL